MRTSRFNTLPKAIGLTLALAVGSGAMASCTGERPTFRSDPSPVAPVIEDDDCPTKSFTYPGSDLTPEEWRDHYYEQDEEADLTLTSSEEATYYRSFVDSLSFDNSASVMESVLSSNNVDVVVGEVPDTLSNRPEEITQPLLDASARNILMAYANLPKAITDLLSDSKLQLFLTAGIHKEGEPDSSAYYIPPTSPVDSTKLVLDVSENTHTGDVFIWGLAQMLAPKICGPNSTLEKFRSYNPNLDSFEYGMPREAIYDQGYDTALVDPSVKSLREDFVATLQALLEDGLDNSCRPDSDARYGSPSGEFVRDSGECRKGRYVLKVVAAIDEEAAQYLAVPAYFSNGNL